MNGRVEHHLLRALQHPLGAWLARTPLTGRRFACPCCGSSFRRLRTFEGRDRMCWTCGSLERHRLVALHLDAHPSLLGDVRRVLHIAPERALRRRLEVPGVEYVGGDLTAEWGEQRLDVTALPFPGDRFDVVVCNHVLEHVPDDAAALRELHRVLRPGGWALLLVPDLEGDVAAVTDEAPGIDDPEEQLRRFGQRDHVRRYGWDYLDRLRTAGFEVEVVRPVHAPAEVERSRLAKRGTIEPLVLGTKRRA